VLTSGPFTQATPFREYSVVGEYAETGLRSFVRHVAILKNGQPLVGPARVEVYHMGPPIVAGDKSAAAVSFDQRSCRADVVADIALDAEEREAIEDWLAEVEKQDRSGVEAFQQYVVMPHLEWVRSAETGRRIRQRFSCAGFVIECYGAAEIVLIDTKAELPEVDEELLAFAYPDLAKLERADERIRTRYGFKGREDLGLHGQGPWRVVLAGYLFHSLKRATADNPRPAPYVPQSASEGRFSG